MLKDTDTLSSIGNPKTLYFKDLGPQIGWTTVIYKLKDIFDFI